jgi:hypothetical protein
VDSGQWTVDSGQRIELGFNSPPRKGGATAAFLFWGSPRIKKRQDSGVFISRVPPE